MILYTSCLTGWEVCHVIQSGGFLCSEKTGYILSVRGHLNRQVLPASAGGKGVSILSGLATRDFGSFSGFNS